MSYQIYCADSALKLKDIESDSIGSLVTDPPAGISFMGQHWDSDKGSPEKWIEWLTGIMREVYRVMKPGAHGLVWALPRISHRTATALELAGFEIRDIVYHLFGSGFPKSMDIGKAIDKKFGAEREVTGKYGTCGIKSAGGSARLGIAAGYKGNAMTGIKKDIPVTDAAKKWDGWGTAQKPCIEHWILIRKPLGEKTIVDNVLKHGVGGINIDACRVPTDDNEFEINQKKVRTYEGHRDKGFNRNSNFTEYENKGRWPAQLIHDGSPEVMQEFEKYGEKTSGGDKAGKIRSLSKKDGNSVTMNKANNFIIQEDKAANSGSIARFFYCAKAATGEKNEGAKNDHPTVKSIELMKYLITLITPPGETVLDPFAGSGSTLCASELLGFNSIGITDQEKHFNIMKARLEHIQENNADFFPEIKQDIQDAAFKEVDLL